KQPLGPSAPHSPVGGERRGDAVPRAFDPAQETCDAQRAAQCAPGCLRRELGRENGTQDSKPRLGQPSRRGSRVAPETPRSPPPTPASAQLHSPLVARSARGSGASPR